MTATPIPRTLAITAYGEMDVSIIDELPAGRKPIETRWALPKQLDSILATMRELLRQGQQAYVICPLIEESEMLDVKMQRKFTNTYLPFSLRRIMLIYYMAR